MKQVHGPPQSWPLLMAQAGEKTKYDEDDEEKIVWQTWNCFAFKRTPKILSMSHNISSLISLVLITQHIVSTLLRESHVLEAASYLLGNLFVATGYSSTANRSYF